MNQRDVERISVFAAIVMYLYYLRITAPINQHVIVKTEPVTVSTVNENFSDASRLLQMDAYEQKLAWQRIQIALLLNSTPPDQIHQSDFNSPDELVQMHFDLASVATPHTSEYISDNLETFASRKERLASYRSLEDRLVDRAHAAFSLLPDTPRSYNGVQVPFSVHEFRDYIQGYWESEHLDWKRKVFLSDISGSLKEEMPIWKRPFDPEKWQQNVQEYLEYTLEEDFEDYEFAESDEMDGPMRMNVFDGWKRQVDVPDDGLKWDRQRNIEEGFCAPADLHILPHQYQQFKDHHSPQHHSSLEAIHKDRLANDPHYLRPRGQRIAQ